MSLESRAALVGNVLAVADSKLVLGNWYLKGVHNGRALPDFAALLAMSATSLGHTRALYKYLIGFGEDYSYLERGRGRGEIRSMNLLDAAPESWEDFLTTIYLAEQSTWMMMSGFLNAPDPALVGLAKKIGTESYFHLKYAAGWRSIFFEGKNETYREALSNKFPLALQWFGTDSEHDVLLDQGMRNVGLVELRKALLRQVLTDHDAPGFEWVSAAEAPTFGNDWDVDKRRAGELPEGLYEIVKFQDPAAVHD